MEPYPRHGPAASTTARAPNRPATVPTAWPVFIPRTPFYANRRWRQREGEAKQRGRSTYLTPARSSLEP